MAATALIKITQGPNTDSGGVAVLGTVADGQVVVTNDDNTDVVSWEIYLYDVPPGSGLSIGLLASAATSTPMANFTPDVDGSYRIGVIVTGPGGTTDTDYRVFGIPFSTGRGMIAPPYQKLPDPLPVLGSGEPGEKPDEMNFGSQARGWAGDNTSSRKLLHQLVKEVNDIIDIPSIATADDEDVLSVNLIAYREPIGFAFDDTNIWALQSNFSTTAVATIYPGMTRIERGSGLVEEDVNLGDADEIFVGAVYDNAAFLWVVSVDLASGDGQLRKVTPGSPTVAAAADALNSANGIGAITMGGTYLWAVDDTDIIRIDTTSPSGPYTKIAAGGKPDDVTYDADTSNYTDVLPRVWVADSTLPGVRRVELSTPGLDGFLTIANTTPMAVAVGGGFVWTVSQDSGAGNAATMYRVVPDPISLSTSSTNIDTSLGVGADPLDVVYDTANAKVFVYGTNTAGDAILLRVNPTTMAVDGTVTLEAATVPSAGGPPPRIEVFNGYVWVAIMDVGVSPRIYRVDPLTMAKTSVIPLREILWAAGSSNSMEQVGTGPTTVAVLTTTRIIRCLTTGGAVTVNLTNSWGASTGGHFVTVVDADGSAATNNITINPPGGDTLNGGASLTITTNRGSVTLYRGLTGTDWSIV